MTAITKKSAGKDKVTASIVLAAFKAVLKNDPYDLYHLFEDGYLKEQEAETLSKAINAELNKKQTK